MSGGGIGAAFMPRGIWGAVLLPVDGAGGIDWGALSEQVAILCASDLAGIYTNGTAGEFHSQTEAEFDRLSELVAGVAAKAGKPFQIGVSNSNARLARERLARITALGPDAVQITLPDWWPPSVGEVQRFVEGMQAAAGDVPLVLYNPPHAKVGLSLAQIAGLRDRAPGLVGAKLAGGDAGWYEERRRVLAGFSVFVAGHTVAFGRPLGADGAYSNVACLSPNGAVWHWRLIESDPAAAVAFEARFREFLTTWMLPLAARHGLSDAALDKLMAAAGGWGPVGPQLLWPYGGASADDVARVGDAARRDLPELFV
jgi:dihydrodipicolinate synthase/N-acetylneuraminate lyase